MKHLFKPEAVRNTIAVVIIFIVIKSLWVLIEVYFLPSHGIEHIEKKSNNALYYRVKLTPNEAPVPTVKKKKLTNKPVGNIKEIKLLAIYNALDKTVITIEYKSKTQVLARGESVNGFTLEGAGSDFAIFSKKGKTYEVLLERIKNKSKSSAYSKRSGQEKNASIKVQRDIPKGDVIDVGDHKIIDQSLFDHYIKNMDAIYEDIGITEVKEGKTLKGFSISFVKRDSLFAKLGVRRGDIIKSVNGQEINSYNAAFGIYKSIQNVKNLTLVIERRNEEMELEYEIN